MANEERINNPSISFLRLLTNLHNLHHNQSILKSYKKKEKKKGRKTKTKKTAKYLKANQWIKEFVITRIQKRKKYVTNCIGRNVFYSTKTYRSNRKCLLKNENV